MESSTPNMQIGSRRLLRNPSNYISPLEKNNDEIERSKRRSNAVNLRRVSQISNTSTNDSPVVNNVQHLNKQEVLATLNKWHKMHTENKITKHNVWNLHVVEYMRRYLGMQSDAGSVDMLKFASSALDVSSKVYGLRVDSVYDTSLKLASRINRICAQGDAGSDSEDVNIDDGAEDAEHNTSKNKSTGKKKLKRRFPKATIAKDDSELFGTFPQIETGLFNTQTYIKNSMVENLFSSRLPLSKSGTTMKLLNEECAWRQASDIDPLISEALVRKAYLIQLPLKTLPSLCPELQKFIIDEWDPEQVEISHRTLEEVVYDKDGFPIPDLDATLNNANGDFENGGAIYNDSDDEGVDGQILTEEMAQNRDVAYVVDFNPDNSNILLVNEYSYISNIGNVNRQLSQIWAGPSHWKVKTLKRSVARYTGKQDDKQENKRARRPKREVENVTFTEDMSDKLLNKLCKSRKAPPFAEKEKLFVPLLQLEVMMLNKMLFKFASVSNKFKKGEDTEKTSENNIHNNSAHMDDNVDDGLEHYDHNNLNNSQYCSQNAVAEEDCVDQNFGNFFENNLVDKPDMVTQSQLSYQTHAKKIDMRKLKRAIWDCLTNANKNDAIQEKLTTSVRFTDLLKKVPPKLSAQARSELTCHTVFVALLHLANEHCLALETSDDITIRQD